MVGITTPRYDDDFVMTKFHELTDRDDGYAIQAATWEVNPNLTKADFSHALARNLRRTMRDFGAEPSGVIESFWADPDFVNENPCEACRNCPVWKRREIIPAEQIYHCREYDKCKANPYRGNGEWRDELLLPDANAEYFMHFDLSKNKDALGFALGHVVDYIRVELDGYEIQEIMKDRAKYLQAVDEDDRYEERPIIAIDALGWLEPRHGRDRALMKNGEIYYTAIENRIIKFLMDYGYQIVHVSFDQFQSLHIKQRITDWGIETDIVSLDRNDEVPTQSKNAIVENRVIYPWDRKFADEARHLKWIKGKKVDHARGKDKATTDAVFGTIYGCENFSSTGDWVPCGDEDL
jgi:hypothetical protein